MQRACSLALTALLALLMGSEQQDNAALQKSLKDDAVHEAWIYNDLDEGFAQARKTGKPLLVVFRCVT